jgi:hypothetical protein
MMLAFAMLAAWVAVDYLFVILASTAGISPERTKWLDVVCVHAVRTGAGVSCAGVDHC